MCDHVGLIRHKVFDQALLRASKKTKKKSAAPSGYICCTCGKQVGVDKEHFNAKHPYSYSYDDLHIWCWQCDSSVVSFQHEALGDLVDILENAGLEVSSEPLTAKDDVVTKLWPDQPPSPSSSASSLASPPPSSSSSSTTTSLPSPSTSSSVPFYFTAPTKDYLTIHFSKLSVAEKTQKKQKNMHGGHGHTHGPMSAIKKGMAVSPSVWSNMDVNARQAAINAGARSPAMVAHKRMLSLLDSPGYVQGVACSVFQAVVEVFFRGNTAFSGLSGIICSFLFSQKARSLKAFAEECLLMHLRQLE